MSQPIPIACPAQPGTAGYVSAAPSGPAPDSLRASLACADPSGTVALPAYLSSGIRYGIDCGVLDNSPVYGRPGCVTFADGHKPLFSLNPRTSL